MNADPQPCLHGKNSTGREKEGDPAHTPVGRPDIMSEGFGINTVYKFQCCRAGAGGACTVPVSVVIKNGGEEFCGQGTGEPVNGPSGPGTGEPHNRPIG